MFVASFTPMISAPGIGRSAGSCTIPLIVPFGDCATLKLRKTKDRIRKRRAGLARKEILLPLVDSHSLVRYNECEEGFCTHRPQVNRRNRGPASTLRMVRVDSQVREEHLFPTGTPSVRVRFHGYEHRVNLGQRFRVVEFENPPLLRCVVFVKDSQIERSLLVRPSLSPCLECARFLKSWLL